LGKFNPRAGDRRHVKINMMINRYGDIRYTKINCKINLLVGGDEKPKGS
jgi:hypothetical protein